MKAATAPPIGRPARRLLVIDERGLASHHASTDLPDLLRRGDLVVANDAATIPASLTGMHLPTGRTIEVRLAGRTSLLGRDVSQFTAVVFGLGDYRIPTESRGLPPALIPGDALQLGLLRATVIETHSHPRLIDLRFEHEPEEVWQGLARHGRPIQYAYVPERLALWDVWTSIASRPVAFEAPSAGFVLDWAMLDSFRARGIAFATITHAAGISSTGDPELDRLLPFDEPYSIPATTARLIQRTQLEGGRIVAIGTTVVRALEHAALAYGRVIPGEGLATNRIGPTSPLRVVDAIVSGVHESGSSHYQLLNAFQNDAVLERMAAEADRFEYRTHEFGDVVMLSAARLCPITDAIRPFRDPAVPMNLRQHCYCDEQLQHERRVVETDAAVA